MNKDISKVKVSVAIATYNGERFLREQLDSLYSQTRVPDEIVVCDDRSTDGTKDILEEYHQKYGLTYYINDTNLGVNKNFEKAIRLCSGDYVAICDQDDVWMPHKIQTCLVKLQEIEGTQPACVSSQGLGVNKDMKIISKPAKKTDTCGLKANILGSHNAQGCTMMLNRKLVGLLSDFPSKELMYDGYIGLITPCVGIKYNISEPLMCYRHHESNVVGKIDNHEPLIPRIVNHLRMWKYDIPFDHNRFHSLQLIKEMHGSIMSKESLELINKLQRFNESGLGEKIVYIYKEDFFKIGYKINTICKLLFTYYLPI